MDPPRVSVVMAVYNAQAFLAEAIDSVLAQTLRDFELVAIDDCSSDGSLAILKDRAAQDARVRVVRNERNLGQVASLNRGIACSGAPYVALMDADDVCRPERLHRQADYLDAHPEVGVVGVLSETFEYDIRAAHRSTNRADGSWLDGDIVMVHPTMMVRREVYARHGMYDPRYDDAGDYEIQSRFAHGGTLLHVIDEPLFYYRVHNASMTATRRRHQVAAALRVSFRTIFRYRRMLSARGWKVLARYGAIYLYLLLRMENVIPRSLGKRLWPSR